MMVPTKLLVLKAITTTIEAVVPTSTPFTNYAAAGITSLAGRVFRGRVVFGENDPVPCISILEHRRDDNMPAPAPRGSQKGLIDWPLIIQGWADEDDPDHPTDIAHYLLADVKQVLAKSDHTGEQVSAFATQDILGFPFITQLAIGSGDVYPADELSNLPYFVLPITLTLTEDRRKPFVST